MTKCREYLLNFLTSIFRFHSTGALRKIKITDSSEIGRIENGNILSAAVEDEIKNIRIPMAVSSNRKKAQLNYIHGGVLVDQVYEILDINATCETK